MSGIWNALTGSGKSAKKPPRGKKPATPEKKEVMEMNTSVWLSQDDINGVIRLFLRQNPLLAKTFRFYGAVDVGDLPSVVIRRSGAKTSCGIIILANSHWVSCFITTTTPEERAAGAKNVFCYFDSTGNKAGADTDKVDKCARHSNPDVCAFITRVLEDKVLGGKGTWKVIYNEHKHQRGLNECGMYACYHTIERLKGTSCRKINSSIKSDVYMAKLRTQEPYKSFVPQYD
jgi:hypothetical protein